MSEIIVHSNQSQLEDYLKEPNELCVGCRWCVVEKCLNSCCDEFDKDIKDIDLKECDGWFPFDETELYKVSRDTETNSLLDED